MTLHTPTSKPRASVSLDLDDLWSYLRTRGDPSWQSRPSYLSDFLPRALQVMDRIGVKITFFVVGFDAARKENHPHLRAIVERGHEIGNHSFSHECWLHRYSTAELEADISNAEEALHAATGQQPRGFRGPGFSWSAELFEVLARRHYIYDASTFPTFLGPLARLYFLASTRLTPAEREERSALFGGFRDGLRPNQPYHWRLQGGRTLLEIPVTTIPVIRTPFHMSYLLYLSRFSTALMRAYLNGALAACRALRVEPSFLLHPLDLLSGDQYPQLSFFPGMDLPGHRKERLFTEVLGVLASHFELMTLGEQASGLLATGRLTQRTPVLAT
jgi:peptidoglycan/xylan/chitin deacetylase (PgdA/CDA1 family)